MMEIVTLKVQTNSSKEVTFDSIGKDTEKVCQSIYPLHDIFVRKGKMLKKPKFELGKHTELYGEGSSSKSLLGMRQVLKQSELMDMRAPIPRICLKFSLFMMTSKTCSRCLKKKSKHLVCFIYYYKHSSRHIVGVQ